MKGTHSILTGPLLLSLLAIAFCIWSAFGNDVNFCVTTGCTLYQDFTIAKISLWWFGACAFAILAACAMLGQARAGRWLAGFFLAGDCCLLILMVVTAPCISCLVVALFFALCYVWFRRQSIIRQQRPGGTPVQVPLSILLWVWIALFVANIGQVAKSQMDIWPILNESGEPTIRMFFSPSCKYCVEGINALSGNVNVAFYPVAEYDSDIAKVAKMMVLLEEGQNLANAIQQTREEDFTSFCQFLRPDILLLRFRMLRNKAHLFAQGSQSVPFFEKKGLPLELARKNAASKPERPRPVAMPEREPLRDGNPDMPEELLDGAQCGGAVPCPPAQSTPHTLQ